MPNAHESSAARSPGADRSVSNFREEVLSIETVVSVTLARKKISLRQILDMVPGSMLNFDVHCDQALTLEAAETPLALGETVKIGDKFGLRIREIIRENAP
ncbi:MAG: FliM/FliN family flagellar motor C-terminal domain-containing protein [Planctomycetota bacterium]